MADGRIQIAVDLDVSTLEASLAKIGEMAGKSVSTASKAVSGSISTVQSTGKQIKDNLSGAFSTVVKAAGNAGTAISQSAKTTESFSKGFQSVNKNLSGTEKAAQGFGKSIPDSIQAPLAAAAQAGVSSIQNLSKSMAGGSFPASVQTAGGMLKTFGQSVLTLASAEVPAANDAMGMFSYGVTAASAALNGIALGISTYNMLSSAASAVTGVWSSAVQVLNTMEAAHALTLVASNGGLTVMQTIVGVLTGQITLQTAATGLATKAQALFSAAVNSTFIIIGAVIAAVALLVVGIMALCKALNKETEEEKKYREETERMKQATEDACEANKQFNDSIRSGQSQRQKNLENSEAEIQAAETLATKLYDLAEKENKTTAEKQQMQAIVDRLNKALPELGLSFDAETGALNKNRDEVMKNISAKRELARQNAAMDMMTEAYKDQFKAEAQLTSLKKMKSAAEKEYQELQSKGSDLNRTEKDRMEMLQGNVEALDTQIKDATDTVISSANEVSSANALYSQSFNETGESVQTSQQKIVDACKNSAQAAGAATGDVRTQVKTFLETMQLDSATYGQNFITAWTNALQTASPEALGSVEAFVAYVISTMDKTPEFGNIAVSETGAYTEGVNAGLDSAAQTAEGSSTAVVESLDKTAEAGEKGAKTGESYTNNIECEIKAAPEITDAASSEAAGKLDKSGEAGQAGANTAAAFANGLSQGKSQAAQAFQGVLDSLKSGGSLEDFAADMQGYGYDSLAKLAAGMGESEDMIAQKLADVSGMTVDTVKSLFAQQGAEEAGASARAMMSSTGTAIEQEGQTVIVRAANVGKNIALGVAAGIGVGTPFIVSAARSAVNQAVQAAKAA